VSPGNLGLPCDLGHGQIRSYNHLSQANENSIPGPGIHLSQASEPGFSSRLTVAFEVPPEAPSLCRLGYRMGLSGL
jgi:hypothetical protein